MVLEAFAAVSLAGNIFQFIDFSCKLFTTTASIHRSYVGSTQNVQQLDSITQALQQWCNELASLQKAHAQQLAGLRNQSLVRLGTDCEAAAAELLSATNALKAKNPSSKWSSFKAALAATWNNSQIKDMERRLDSYRLQLILELDLMQSNDQASIMTLLDDLSRTNRRVGADMTMEISKLKVDVKDTLEKLRADMKAMKDMQSQVLTTKSGSAMEQGGALDQNYQHIATMLENCRAKESDIAISLILLDSICFEQMKFRHAKISDVHPETFDWVFAAKFESWAQSPDPMFWISGKPGSGKSTLMKHIVDNNRTPTLLAGWSGLQNLVIASYFFWINGTAIQRSQEGLLRALLYDALHQSPSLIKHALPETWEAVNDRLNSGMGWRAPPWTREELLDAFKRLSTIDGMDTRLCVFIDGLDEYDGDQEDLTNTVRHLMKLGVKLCIASRPWNVFEDAFGSDIEKKIYMQELNTPDMQRYVDDRLRSHPNFSRLADREASEITTEIVDKSQGVFLWVNLVVRSLLEGLRNLDSLKLLRKRLRAFPSDLDEYFRHMFHSLDPIYRTHLAHMFRIALTATRLLSPVAYWFLDTIEDDPDMALAMPVQMCSRQDVADKIHEVTVRMNGRSKGLLEVVLTYALESHERKEGLDILFHSDPAVEASVDFLHRTVKDFLMTTEMNNILSDWQEQTFQPNLVICKIMLAEFSYSAWMPRFLDDGATLKPIITEFLLSARQYEESTRESPIVYVDRFEQVFTRQPYLADNLWRIWKCSSFLELAIIYDLRLYVAAKLRRTTVLDAQKIHLLMFMVRRNSFWEDNDGDSSQARQPVEMMSNILNDVHGPVTDAPFLQLLEDRLLPQNRTDFENNLNALLQHSVINVSTGDEIIAARSRWLEPDDPSYRCSMYDALSTPSFDRRLDLRSKQPPKSTHVTTRISIASPNLSSKRTSLRGSFRKIAKKLL